MGKKPKPKRQKQLAENVVCSEILTQQHEMNYSTHVYPSIPHIRIKTGFQPTVFASLQPLADFIYIIDGFLLPSECLAWIRTGESVGFEQCFQRESSDYAHRDQGRLQFEDESIGMAIYSRLRPFLPPTVDGRRPFCCSSNMRLYKYCVGQRFGRHIDESNKDERTGGITVFTLLIYLNGGEETTEGELGESLSGGETLFYGGHGRNTSVTVSVSPKQGQLLLHGHGHRCLTHEGAEVTSGAKYVLRTDVVYV
jgi:hypothetical protein